MIRSEHCGSCKFHLGASTFNVTLVCLLVYLSGNLLPAAALALSISGWLLHWETCSADDVSTTAGTGD